MPTASPAHCPACSMIDPDVVLLTATPGHYLVKRSRRRPATLFVDVTGAQFARGAILVKCPPNCMRFLLALIGRPGAIVPAEDIVDVIYGHRVDGGPEGMQAAIDHAWKITRAALATLGYAHEHTTRGFSAWPRVREYEMAATYPRHDDMVLAG